MPVAPRIVNDVSYVMGINHQIHFAWQGHYLVRLEDDVSYVMRINHEVLCSTG